MDSYWQCFLPLQQGYPEKGVSLDYGFGLGFGFSISGFRV